MNRFIDKENEVCLFIYDKLLESFENCSPHSDTFLNLVGIFYHDLMRILTGYFIKRNLIKNKRIIVSKNEIKYDVKSFPYISYKDVKDGINLSSKIFYRRDNTLKKQQFSLEYVSTFYNNNSKVICMSDSIFKNKLSFLNLLFKGFSFKYIRDCKIEIPNLDFQTNILSDKVAEIFAFLGKDLSPDGMIDLIKSHINLYVGKQNRIEYDLLLIGTMTNLNSRINAATARKNNIPVISISHGEGDQLMFDEPRFGYSERSYPNILFGYGPLGSNLKNSKYLKCLYGPPKYYTSNSHIISRIYVDESVETLKTVMNTNWMYVPDSLQYVNRYGPWGNIPDNIYLNWQKELVKSFRSIIYKRHPKGHQLFRNQSNDDIKFFLDPDNLLDIKIISEDFSQVFNKCDAYLFDHISTAFMIACATKKPIVYFDIGKRNLIPHAEELIKKRCIYINIDPSNPENIIDKIKEANIEGKINLLTKAYSLDEELGDEKRDARLIRLVESLIN